MKRMVTALYVDDKGQLVVQLGTSPWPHYVMSGPSSGVEEQVVGTLMTSQLGKPGGVAKLDGNGHLPPEEATPFLPQLDALPPPGPDYSGSPVRVKLPSEETPSGTKTELFVCVLSSQDEYQWVKLSEST